ASATVTETPASTTIIRTPASATVTETPASTTIIRTPASATQELLSRQIVTFIARALAKELVITRDRDKGSAGPIGPRQVEEAVDHFNAVRPAALEKVKMEVSFNREKNAVQIAVTGDLQPAAAAEVILADPQAALPALIETTAAMISSRPDSAEEIVKTVAAIVEQITIRDPAKAAELSEIMVKDLHADQQTIANAPTHHEAQTAQTMAEAKIRVAGHVAAALPEHFIPALVAQHSAATTEKAQKTIEPLVRQAAGTVAGASHVIDKVAQDKTGEFAASSAGKIAIVEAAGSIIGKASEAQHSEPAAVPATLHLLLPAIKAPAVKEIVAKELTVKDTAVKKTAVKETDKAAQIITIARLVIAANPGKFSPANLTEETAQTFIGFVARVQKSLAPVAAKKTSRAKPAAVRTINHHVRYQARTPISPAKQFAAQAMQQGNVPERARALNEVLTYARENNLMVPKAIIQNIFAGLAGVLPQAVRAEISFLPALSGESASSSSLKRITAMLEAQMTQAVARKSAPAWDRVFVLSAQAFLYGTIMRLVKGRIGRVDEVIEQLRQRGVLGRIIRGIKEGNLDLVADYLSDLVLETEVKGILNALAA
ncbi:MAG TPA: hypothetical protein VMT55_03430, partial [Candidatus Sulfotelmatobacter sp.]|nr:hypothetical protein [Candidatus Sulfotelmatobacter sp.]